MEFGFEPVCDKLRTSYSVIEFGFYQRLFYVAPGCCVERRRTKFILNLNLNCRNWWHSEQKKHMSTVYTHGFRLGTSGHILLMAAMEYGRPLYVCPVVSSSIFFFPRLISAVGN